MSQICVATGLYVRKILEGLVPNVNEEVNFPTIFDMEGSVRTEELLEKIRYFH